MNALAPPFHLGGKEVFTSVSIGIALSNRRLSSMPKNIVARCGYRHVPRQIPGQSAL